MSASPHAPVRPASPQRHAVAALAPVVAAFILGNLATFPNLPWYAELRKPPFNPPDWLFGPAWTVLYLLMAWAFFRVLRQPVGRPGRGVAIAAFMVQITLNAAWSWAFFAAHNPLFGVVVIAALLAAIVVTMVVFFRLDRAAGLVLLPYLAWVAFAATLNGSILALNP